MRRTFLAQLAILFFLSVPVKAESAEAEVAINRNPSWALKLSDVPEVPKLFLVEPSFIAAHSLRKKALKRSSPGKDYRQW